MTQENEIPMVGCLVAIAAIAPDRMWTPHSLCCLCGQEVRRAQEFAGIIQYIGRERGGALLFPNLVLGLQLRVVGSSHAADSTFWSRMLEPNETLGEYCECGKGLLSTFYVKPCTNKRHQARDTAGLKRVACLFVVNQREFHFSH